MSDPLLWHWLPFAFTRIFCDLFPQLALGLVLLILGRFPPHGLLPRIICLLDAILDP